MIRIALPLWLLAAPAFAAPGVLRVYTKPIEPFAFQKEGAPEGFSLELWQRVAREAGLKYELSWVKTMPELMEAVQSGKADVAVAAISITSAREKVIDFSTPYYESGLQILVEGGGGGQAAAVIATLFDWSFLRLIGLLVLALLASSHLLWWFEHRATRRTFPRATGTASGNPSGGPPASSSPAAARTRRRSASAAGWWRWSGC